jgi:polyisoprenoid-binding protein YceI
MKFVSALLVFGLAAHAATLYDIRPQPGAQLALTVEKTGLYRGKKHLFLFEKYEGRLDFDAQKPEDSKIELTIDSRSLVCKDDWISESDRKSVVQTAFDDMLAVNRYSTMTFRGTSIKPLGGDRYEVQGTLTIRDLPKPNVVSVQLTVLNSSQLKLSGTATIRLTDYKLKPPSAILGAIGTKDDMTLNFVVIASASK